MIDRTHLPQLLRPSLLSAGSLLPNVFVKIAMLRPEKKEPKAQDSCGQLSTRCGGRDSMSSFRCEKAVLTTLSRRSPAAPATQTAHRS